MILWGKFRLTTEKIGLLQKNLLMIRDFCDCTKDILKEMEEESDPEEHSQKGRTEIKFSTFMDAIFLSDSTSQNVNVASGEKYLLSFSSITY